MSKYLNLPNIYTLIALLYLCLGSFLEGISILTLSVHGLFLAMTIWVLFLTLKECMLNNVMKILAVLFLLITIYGVWLIYMETDYGLMFDHPTRYLDTHFKSIAPVFVFYYFSEKGLITKKWFYYAAPLFLIAVYEQHIVDVATLALRYDADLGEFQDNTGYYFLSLLPIAAFFKDKKWIQYLIIAFCSIMIVMCMKRGPIIIALIIDIIILLDSLKGSKLKLRTFVLLCIAGVVVYLAIRNFYLSNDFFSFRIEQTLEGNDSNRNNIYNTVWSLFTKQQGVITYLFGNGAYGCARFTGMHAHNDWLEMLLSVGLLGTCLYAYYFIAQFKFILKSKHLGVDKSILIVLITIVISNFMKTFFSMSIDDMMIYSSSMLGFCLSQCNKWNINQNTNIYGK